MNDVIMIISIFGSVTMYYSPLIKKEQSHEKILLCTKLHHTPHNDKKYLLRGPKKVSFFSKKILINS